MKYHFATCVPQPTTEPELPWLWGASPTLDEIESLYRRLERIADESRSLADRLERQYAHPDLVRLRLLACEFWQSSSFDCHSLRRLHDELRVRTDLPPGEIGALPLVRVNELLRSWLLGASPKKKSGRRAPSPEKRSKRRRLCEAWQQFHQAHAGTKKEFCKDRNITVQALEQALDAERKARRREMEAERVKIANSSETD